MPKRGGLAGTPALLEQLARARQRGRNGSFTAASTHSMIRPVASMFRAARGSGLRYAAKNSSSALSTCGIARSRNRRGVAFAVIRPRAYSSADCAMAGRAERAVHEAQRLRFRVIHGLAGDHHVQRGLHADQSRQALRAAGARQQSQLHFGEAHLHIVRRTSEVTGERDFEPAAEHRAVKRGDDRLPAGFYAQEHVVQQRLLRGLIHFLDVGAGDEVASRAVEDDGLDRRVFVRLDDRRKQAFSDRMRDRVDRRIVDGDERDVAVPLERDRVFIGP